MPELDRLKEEVAYMKFWQGIAVVIAISLAGWLVSATDEASALTFALAVAGVVLLGAGILIMYRRIGRRIDKIGEL